MIMPAVPTAMRCPLPNVIALNCYPCGSGFLHVQVSNPGWATACAMSASTIAVARISVFIGCLTVNSSIPHAQGPPNKSSVPGKLPKHRRAQRLPVLPGEHGTEMPYPLRIGGQHLVRVLVEGELVPEQDQVDPPRRGTTGHRAEHRAVEGARLVEVVYRQGEMEDCVVQGGLWPIEFRWSVQNDGRSDCEAKLAWTICWKLGRRLRRTPHARPARSTPIGRTGSLDRTNVVAGGR